MPKLTAKECRKFIDAVVEKAAAMGAPVSVAVVGAVLTYPESQSDRAVVTAS